MDEPTEVRVHSDEYLLAAYLYPPADREGDGESRPCVILLQGYSGLRHVYGLHLPRLLSRHGFWAVTFDHRGFGRSGGRTGRVRPLEQAQDVHDVISYVDGIDGVDRERIALHGSSFGAANALQVAAFDDRVKAVVSCVGVHDCPRWMETLHGPAEWAALRADARAAERERARTGQEVWIPYGRIVPPDPHTQKVAEEHGYADDLMYIDHYDAGSIEALLRYRPEKLAHLVSPRPVLIIYAELDGVVAPQEAHGLYEALDGPKRLVELKGAYHYDAYHFVNPQVADVAAEATVDFLDETFATGERVATSGR